VSASTTPASRQIRKPANAGDDAKFPGDPVAAGVQLFAQKRVELLESAGSATASSRPRCSLIEDRPPFQRELTVALDGYQGATSVTWHRHAI